VTTDIQFSTRAADKVRALMEDEGNDSLKLRVFITGGGCSGFSYGFTFDEDVSEEDAVVENAGVTLVVDAMSYQYLVGAEVDYREDLRGAQFIVANPNAATTCGCGNSFSI
jgi:iron-sulfur cluster insertion protein